MLFSFCDNDFTCHDQYLFISQCYLFASAYCCQGRRQSYLACGKPIIAALDGEGARVVDESGAGITCSAENPKALAEAVLKMYNMSGKEREEMGKRGRSYFEKHFEREMLIDRLDGWMKELVTPSH